MVIFRENTEDIYAGIEYKANSDEVRRVIEFLQQQMGVQNIRFPRPARSASSQCPRRARSD